MINPGDRNMKWLDNMLVQPGSKVKLDEIDPSWTGPFKSKKEAHKETRKVIAEMDELQQVLYADNSQALLIILQAMDAAGKDGTIRHVLGAMNPQGCRVTSFKKPSDEEMDHDFLWRIHRAVPRYGEIGVFNRSHYEDVLIVRVHNLVPKTVWSKRYRQINDFEYMLARNRVRILKFFLHISKEEQKERFQDRLDNPDKHWKFSQGDVEERKRWTDYRDAYETALRKCSTREAPWYVIPANHKWFRNVAVSSIICRTMRDMKLNYPKVDLDPAGIVIPD